MFKGIYRENKQIHPPDIEAVLERAFTYGIDRIMVTAGSLAEVKETTTLVKRFSHRQDLPKLATTIGVHPTRCNEFDEDDGGADNYLQELRQLASRHRELGIIAVGEFGLDYDRVKFCTLEVQRKYFDKQFILADETDLPLFLHMRDAATDFVNIVRSNRHRFPTGVVHSFTGTAEEAQKLLDLDLFIGINVRGLPLSKLMVESDAPWCEIRPSHAGFAHIQTRWESMAKEKHDPKKGVKSRNEPIASLQILECLASLHKRPIEEIATIIYGNSTKVFSSI